MNSLFSRDLCAALVLSFGHFLWIGIVIAAVAAVVVRRQRTAAARYRVWLAALVAMTVSPFVTLAILQTMPAAAPVVVETKPIVAELPPAQRPEPNDDRAAPERLATSSASGDEAIRAGGLNRDRTLPREADAGTLARAVPAPRESAWWRDYAPLVTGLYLIGVALMGLRLSLGLWGGRRLRRRATPITGASLLAALQRQATSLGMKFVPALAYCERVTVPTVLGILKPMILLPVSLASGLAPDQIESVLAHELAHLRRYDHLVNLMQCVIESLLFFHPAIWWVSRRIRDEREHCCDDLVVACGAVPLDYAASLLRVAELSREAEQQRGHNQRRSFTAVSLFATGDRPSTLRQRIARLLGYQTEMNVRAVHPWLLFCLATCCVGAVWVLTSMTWIVLAEINRDRSHTTVIVEWSAVVDESVMQEIRALIGKTASQSAQSETTDETKSETLRCSADELRAILKSHLGNKRLVTLQKSIQHSMPTGGWRSGPEQRFFHTMESETIRTDEQDDPFHSVNWHADGMTMRDEQPDQARLKVEGTYHFGQEGMVPAKATLKFDEVMSDGEATLVLLTPPTTVQPFNVTVTDRNGSRTETRTKQGWNLYPIFVHEAVRIPAKQIEFFKPMTRPEDWIRRGAAGTKAHAARIADWRPRATQEFATAHNPDWTRELPHGGQIELLGIGHPHLAPFIWWDPTGKPIAGDDPNWSDRFPDELIGIVRVSEASVERCPHADPKSNSKLHRIRESQFAKLPMKRVESDEGRITLQVGAGFGPWTFEAKVAPRDRATVNVNGLECRITKVFDFSNREFHTHFHWEPARDIDVGVVAVTKAGQVVAPYQDPTITSHDLSLSVRRTFAFQVPLTEIDHLLVKTRPRQWTEFTGFAIEPTVALDPPLSFAGSNLTANEVAAEQAAWDVIEAMNVDVYGEANHQRELVRHLRRLEKRANFPEKGLQEIRQQLQLPIRDAEFWNVPAKAWPQVGRLLSLRKLGIVASDLRGKPMDEIGRLRDLRRFVVATSKFQPTDLVPLRQLAQLEHLEVTFTVFDETQAQRREQLGDLSEAEQDLVKRVEAVGSDREHLWQTAILTDRALEQLADLKHLRTVKLINTIISSRGVRMLSMLPALEELELGVADESPEVVRLVGAMKSLKRLTGLSLTDDALAEWTTLAQLEELGRYAGGVTDQGVDHLLKMTQLRRLVLWHGQLSDAGLERLATLPHLESLDVRFSKSLSQAGVERFQQRNPKCKIAFEQPADTNAAGAAGQSALPPKPQHDIANLTDGPRDESPTQPTVTGTVVSPEGKPVAGIEVLAFQGGKQLEQKFTTDEKGEFRVPKAWREVDHWLTVVAREGRERLGWFDFMIHGHSIGGQNPQDGSFRLVLLPMNRTIRGRVLDESGQPLAQIPVRINQLDHEVNSDAVHWKYQKLGDEPLVLGAVTDNDGRFELKLPADSVAMLGTSHPDWVEQRLCVTKEQDEAADIGLVRAAKVAGRVIDSHTGKPLAGITIAANATKTAILESGGDEAKTDTDGRFLIQGLRGGEYTIQLERSPFQTLTAPAHGGAMLNSGETFLADYSLSVGKRLAGRVLDMDTGEPIPSCKVTYTGPARPHNGLSTKTNQRGEFEFFVPPGRSNLDATEGRRFGNDSTREVDVPADGDPEPVVLKVGEKTELVPGSFKIFIGPPLDRKVSLNFKDTPLVEALEHICQTAGMKLELDEASLTGAGYSKEAPVTLVEAKLVRLQDALTLVLKPYEKLSFCVDKNQIFVSTRPQVEAREKPTAKPKSPAENAADKP